MIVQPEAMSLLTNLYELTMAQSYFQEGHNDLATFSLFIRKYPPHRGFFVSCGLEDVLRYLEGFRIEVSAKLQSLRHEIERHVVAAELEPLRRERELGES
jgi:nicotinate phosphoribosyltransferase